MKKLNILEKVGNPQCKLCDLHKTAKHVCIMGSGPSNAKLMFIGETPGFDEDKKGKVFIGKAGSLLDSIFVNLNMSRNNFYITNVGKCHPPYNGKPPKAILDTCSYAYLRKEIKHVQPDLIVCLGAMSGGILLQEANVKVVEKRENLYYTKHPMPSGIPFIVTYHPAATFHMPELLEFIVDDFEWAKRLLNGELPKPKKQVNYQKIDSLDDIPNLESTLWLDLDLETAGLDPFQKNKEILSIQISTGEGEAYYADWTPKISRQLKKLLEKHNDRRQYRINGQNIKFDLLWLRVHADINFDGTINDTYQNIHLIDENFPKKSLDVLCSTFTDLRGHKDELQTLIRQYVKMHKEKKEGIRIAMDRLYALAFRAINEKIRVKYGCGDADGAGRLRRVFKSKLRDQGLQPLHKLMMNVTKTYIDMEYNGVKIDLLQLDEFNVLYEDRIRRARKLLSSIAHVDNPNSHQQLKQLLYGTWRMKSHKIKQGKKYIGYSTGKAALEMMLKDDIEEDQSLYIQQLLEYRKVTKLYNTYVKGMPRFLRDGFIHATWNLCGTETGRSSCSNPNLQQIPRKDDIKKIFIPRYDDGVLVSWDVSQGELRIGAHESNEPTLIKLFNSGAADIHRAVAATSLRKPESKVTEDERYDYKQVNFLIFYGGGIKTLAQAIKSKDRDHAAKIISRWNKTFPRWKEYKEEMEEFIIHNHYIRNSFGRYRHLFIIDPESDEGAAQLRQGINAPIQGGLSDLNKLIGYNVWRRVRDIPNTHFIMEVHDSWWVDTRRKYIRQVAEIIREEGENVDTNDFGFRFKVPIKVDIKIGPNGKDMENYGF